MGESRIVSVYPEVRRTGQGVTVQVDHAHHQLEFNLVVSGKGTYFLADGQLDLVPGTLVWLLPEQSHRLIRSPDFDAWMVTLDIDAFDDTFLADVAEHACRVLSTEDAVALERLLSHVSQDLDDPTLYRAGLTYAMRSARHASMTTAGPRRKRLHPAVLKALSVLRSDDEPPTAGALAKLCGVTQDYLGQLLMDQTGRGFVEWRNRTRLERFHRFYPESRDLLTAALAAGFGSYTQFHRVFSDLVGTTPGDWAKGGGHAKPLGLPGDSVLIQGTQGGSTRMTWYSLCGSPIPLIGQRLGPTFAESLGTIKSLTGLPLIESGAVEVTQLSGFVEPAIADLERTDPEAASRLRRVCDLDNILEVYERTLGGFNIPTHDLANLVAIYVVLSWIGADHRSLASRDQIMQVACKVRAALLQAGTFSDASTDERRLFSTAVIIQSVVVRHALVGARASGSAAIAKHVSDSLHAGLKASLNFDFRGFDLLDEHLSAPTGVSNPAPVRRVA